MGKDLVSKKDNSEMINLDDVTKENIKERNPKWPQIFDHPYRILQMWGWGSGKKSLFNLKIQQPDTDKIYLYAKDTYETHYQLLITKVKEQASSIWMILKLKYQ